MMKLAFKSSSASSTRLDKRRIDTFAWRNDVLLPVQVVFVAFDVASTALECRRWFENVPQWLGAGLAV